MTGQTGAYTPPAQTPPAHPQQEYPDTWAGMDSRPAGEMRGYEHTSRSDLAIQDNCGQAVRRAADRLGGLDILVNLVILVNNVATQSIINTFSVNGLRGNRTLIDYVATKGAVLALTYSLAQSRQERGIRVNSVAHGPARTPLIPATFPRERAEKSGQQVEMGRAAQPDEIVAPSYVFLAAPQLSSYYTGDVLAPIGGETLPS